MKKGSWQFVAMATSNCVMSVINFTLKNVLCMKRDYLTDPLHTLTAHS
jgi:hypothetical protein